MVVNWLIALTPELCEEKQKTSKTTLNLSVDLKWPTDRTLDMIGYMNMENKWINK